MKDEIVNLKRRKRGDIQVGQNIEEKCGKEEKGKLTEEFEAQASVFLPSLYLQL